MGRELSVRETASCVEKDVRVMVGLPGCTPLPWGDGVGAPAFVHSSGRWAKEVVLVSEVNSLFYLLRGFLCEVPHCGAHEICAEGPQTEFRAE